METDYSKHTHFQWKIKWQLEDLAALGIMGETGFLTWQEESRRFRLQRLLKIEECQYWQFRNVISLETCGGFRKMLLVIIKSSMEESQKPPVKN